MQKNAAARTAGTRDERTAPDNILENKGGGGWQLEAIKQEEPQLIMRVAYAKKGVARSAGTRDERRAPGMADN